MSTRDAQYAQAAAMRLVDHGETAVYVNADGVEANVSAIFGPVSMKPAETDAGREDVAERLVEVPRLPAAGGVAALQPKGYFITADEKWSVSELRDGVPGMFCAMLKRVSRVQRARRTGNL